MNLQHTVLLFVGGLFPLVFAAYSLGRHKALGAESRGEALHSHPRYYGWVAVLLMSLPALLGALGLTMLQAAGLARAPMPMVLVALLAAAAGGLWLGLRTIRASLRARNLVEGVLRWLLIGASLLSILTTVGIVLSIIFEALRFFQMVSFWEFLTGTEWSPEAAFLGSAGRGAEQVAEPRFGSVPLFAGTFMITAIAMSVALPIGLFSAIYLSEYASDTVRTFLKPTLEILAGIPTVVYGFFAAVTVSPLVVEAADFLGLDASYNNAISPGLVMGIMIIPLISSLSDDVISSVPMSMREGSFALGATRSETIKHVLLPGALPGVVAAFLLAVSRALGETMIVVMAAGLRPNLTANPLKDVTTVTVRIVDALTGDQAFDSPETLSAFGLGLVLFVVTLLLNLVSIIVVRRYHQKYA